ncbi:MAG: hypothetical protein V7655_04890 [Aequorivita antarctica]
MKHSIYSIIVSVIGISFILYMNYYFAQEVSLLQTNQQVSQPQLIVTPKVHKIAALIIGLIGVFFGIKGFKSFKKLSLIGIVLSLLLVAISFLPLWHYFRP